MNCPPAVVTAFKKADGVVDAEVVFAKKLAIVTYDPQKTNPDKLVKALEGTKYQAVKENEKKE